jgi:hypothetical protein
VCACEAQRGRLLVLLTVMWTLNTGNNDFAERLIMYKCNRMRIQD